ncbi:MAG: hypothetical protein ACREWG_06720 [Gammaproteobacteria bacterium]
MTEYIPVKCPAWLYHAEQGAKLFLAEAELEEAEAQGWADSPAAALRSINIDLQPDASPDDPQAEAALEVAEDAEDVREVVPGSSPRHAASRGGAGAKKRKR